MREVGPVPLPDDDEPEDEVGGFSAIVEVNEVAGVVVLTEVKVVEI